MAKVEGTTYFDLIDLIEQQNQIIISQANIITKLMNENAEKENVINELFKNV